MTHTQRRRGARLLARVVAEAACPKHDLEGFRAALDARYVALTKRTGKRPQDQGRGRWPAHGRAHARRRASTVI